MSLFRALHYYLATAPALILRTNFWVLPLVFINKPVLLKTDLGLSFYVTNIMEAWVINEILLHKQYEEYYTIKKNDIVIDIGASIGDFSIWASRKAKAVYAYEMDKRLVHFMEKNIQHNDAKRVILKAKRALSLDKIFTENNLTKCDLLKIDCEGNEYPIFENSNDKTLQKIDHIAMEIHMFDKTMKKKRKELLNRLRKHFEVIEHLNPVRSDISFVYASRK